MLRPLGFEFSNPDGLHIGLRVFSACRIEDSFVSLTALTPQRRHLIVRLYGLSVLKALQAYTPLTRFRSCGYLAFVRNVTPVTHRLDYPTSLLLCSPSGLRVLEPRRAAHRLTRFTCRPSGLLLLQQSYPVFFQDLRPIRSEQMI